MRWVFVVWIGTGALWPFALDACSSPTGGTAPKDAATDRTTEAEAAPSADDTGVADTGAEGDAGEDGAGECGPSSLTGFKWTYESSFNAPGSCTASDLTTIIDNCFSVGGSIDACDEVEMACYDCVFGVGSTPGAILSRSPTSSLSLVNYGGCVQIADPDGGTTCAHALQAYDACQEYGCRTCNTKNDPTGSGAAACVVALGHACDSYLEQVIDVCYDAVRDGGPAAACAFPPMTFDQGFTAVANVLCVE